MNDHDPNIILGGCVRTSDPPVLRTPAVSHGESVSPFWGFRVVLHVRTPR